MAQATHLAGPLRGVRYLRTRQGVAQIALFDKAAGRTYLLSGGPDTQYTASIVKADIMALAHVLRMGQLHGDGRPPRPRSSEPSPTRTAPWPPPRGSTGCT